MARSSKEAKAEKTPVVETEKSTAAKKTEVKNTETKKEEVKKEEPKKPEAKSAEAAKAVKVEKEAVKVEAPVEKEEDVKKSAAKVKKAAKEKSPVVPEVFVQYQEQQADTSDLVARVKELYVAQKHRESSIKSLQIYIKPQDGKAYYVINDKITGDLDLF